MKVEEYLARNDTHQSLQRNTPGDDTYGEACSGVVKARTMHSKILEGSDTQHGKEWGEWEANFNSKCEALQNSTTDTSSYNAAAAAAVQVKERNQAIISFQEKEIPKLKGELELQRHDCAYKKFNLQKDEAEVAADG